MKIYRFLKNDKLKPFENWILNEKEGDFVEISPQLTSSSSDGEKWKINKNDDFFTHDYDFFTFKIKSNNVYSPIITYPPEIKTTQNDILKGKLFENEIPKDLGPFQFSTGDNTDRLFWLRVNDLKTLELLTSDEETEELVPADSNLITYIDGFLNFDVLEPDVNYLWSESGEGYISYYLFSQTKEIIQKPPTGGELIAYAPLIWDEVKNVSFTHFENYTELFITHFEKSLNLNKYFIYNKKGDIDSSPEGSFLINDSSKLDLDNDTDWVCIRFKNGLYGVVDYFKLFTRDEAQFQKEHYKYSDFYIIIPFTKNAIGEVFDFDTKSGFFAHEPEHVNINAYQLLGNIVSYDVLPTSKYPTRIRAYTFYELFNILSYIDVDKKYCEIGVLNFKPKIRSIYPAVVDLAPKGSTGALFCCFALPTYKPFENGCYLVEGNRKVITERAKIYSDVVEQILPNGEIENYKLMNNNIPIMFNNKITFSDVVNVENIPQILGLIGSIGALAIPGAQVAGALGLAGSVTSFFTRLKNQNGVVSQFKKDVYKMKNKFLYNYHKLSKGRNVLLCCDENFKENKEIFYYSNEEVKKNVL